VEGSLRVPLGLAASQEGLSSVDEIITKSRTDGIKYKLRAEHYNLWFSGCELDIAGSGQGPVARTSASLNTMKALIRSTGAFERVRVQ
jgi:hypothetical protein